MAEDGLNVDHDGLVVQAAAQLEEELGDEDDAENLPAGYPADVSPVPTTPAESEHGSAGAASPPPPSRPSGQPPPFRGAGWSSTLQNLPDEPMSPSGLGQGGKRVRDDPAALRTGEAEAKQSKQAGVLQHLTNRELWHKSAKSPTSKAVGSWCIHSSASHRDSQRSASVFPQVGGQMFQRSLQV